MKKEMTSKERVLAALEHKETDRVPIGQGNINIPVIRALSKHLGLANEWESYGYVHGFSDIIWISADWVGPEERSSWTDYNALKKVNYFGIVTESKKYGSGDDEGFYDEYVEFPLENAEDPEDLDSYWWPSADWFDYSTLKDKIAEMNKVWGQEKAVLLHPVGTIYENAWQLTGLSKMLMDLIANPEFASALIGKVADFYISYYRKALEAAEGQIDIVYCGDDLGTQASLQMSPDTYREVIKPHHKRLFDAIHEYGVKVMYHCDGAIMPIIPDLIDAGIDILEALQFDAEGMDPQLLKDNFGDKLCFHGGISVQSTLPFKSTEEVKQEVIDRIEVLGKNGGYILSPSHVIQAGTPPENVVALYETARNYKRK
ncbi:uroporphyrinogen decarboxylase family protein [Faecalicatena contorta]|uniref:uroporphyrinogen decarboxylase family protein n=1 Tax=Faecalicatena contorta TaxID=39482 RepID=UPI001898EC8B|nr:uroporphyrinogen decarboxylase family protein [Faecalicatena contorta]